MLLEGRPISQAFTTTVEEYNALAQALFAEGTAAKAMAAFVMMNVKSLTLLGNGQRTLTRCLGFSTTVRKEMAYGTR